MKTRKQTNLYRAGYIIFPSGMPYIRAFENNAIIRFFIAAIVEQKRCSSSVLHDCINWKLDVFERTRYKADMHETLYP